MTTPLQPDQPWQLQLKPEQWQNVLQQAIADLRRNHRDEEALQAIRDANEALSVYDEAEAASPGERITSGAREALTGLGEAAADIPRGIMQMVLHPIETVKGIPRIPGALAEGITSDDPQRVARTVGNIGGLLLPSAKTSRGLRLQTGAALKGVPTVGGVAARTVTAPFRFLRSKATAAEAAAEGQILRNQLMRRQLDQPPRPPRTTELPAPAAPDAASALRAQLLKAGVLPEHVDAQVARQLAPQPRATELPIEGEVRAGLPEARAGELLSPMEGQPRGFEVTGPRKTPAVPTTPTILEMQQGITRDPVAQQIARSGMGSPSKARPGHPIWFGESAPTRSPEVRAGELLLPKANPTIGPTMAEFRQLPTAQLVEAFKNAPDELKQLLIVEFRRRHIAIPDLGITP